MNNLLETTLFADGVAELDNGEGPSWTLTATGDMAPTRGALEFVRTKGAEELVRGLRPLVSADVSIANLEVGLADPGNAQKTGVIAERKDFDPFHATMPFRIYSMANNHVKDAGAESLVHALDEFDERNIDYVGVGRNLREAREPCVFDIRGVRVGVLAYAQDEGQLAREDTCGAAPLSWNVIKADAETLLETCDTTVVVMHEGHEFSDVPRIPFKRLCRRLADMGIDVLIGHHSHVPQGVESRGDSLIFYSLGNFIFNSSYFGPYPWTRRSFVPRIHFNGPRITRLELQPIVIDLEPYAVRPADERERRDILDHLRDVSGVLDDDKRHRAMLDDFFTNTFFKEFLGYIRRVGNERDGDFSNYVKRMKNTENIFKAFRDCLDLYAIPDIDEAS